MCGGKGCPEGGGAPVQDVRQRVAGSEAKIQGGLRLGGESGPFPGGQTPPLTTDAPICGLQR